MAMLHAKQLLNINQLYYHRSIFNTEFTGEIVEKVNINGHSAIVPEITGKAYITGIQQFVVDNDDPFKYGFEAVSQ